MLPRCFNVRLFNIWSFCKSIIGSSLTMARGNSSSTLLYAWCRSADMSK